MRLTAARVLAAVTLLTAMVVGGATVQWSARHPLSASWDEAEYLNNVVMLEHTARDRGLVRVAHELVSVDPARPPMYRAVALPVAALLGADAQVLRALSLIAFLLAAVLLYRAARLVSEPALALVASAAFALSYAPLWAAAHFGTEYVLYLGTVGLLYALLLAANRPAAGRSVWLGVLVGASVALGLLSKGTFLLVVVPVVPAFLVAGRRAGVERRTLGVVAAGAAAGFVVAAPWYVVNYHNAIAFGRHAFRYVRHGAPWLPDAFQTLLGPPAALLLLAGVALLVFRYRRVREALTPGARLSLVVALAGAVPMLVFHMFQLNHLMRLASPALIPLLLAAAVAVQAAGGLVSRTAVAVAGAALVFQGGYLAHRFLTASTVQWDWTPLRALSVERGVSEPIVAYLGSGITFDPPSIARSWVLDGHPIRVTWLWHQERGAIDWTQVMASADSADVVVTAPGYAGDAEDRGELDNQYNGEFATRLERAGGFDAPVVLSLGRPQVRVLVFFRRRSGAKSVSAR